MANNDKLRISRTYKRESGAVGQGLRETSMRNLGKEL